MTDGIFDFDNPGPSVGRWPVYDKMRREQPVFHTVINGEPTVILFRYQDVHQVLANSAALVQPSANAFPEYIGSGPAAIFYRESLPHLDRPVHSRLRKVVTQALNPATVSRMADAVGDVIDTHLDALAGKAKVEIVAELGSGLIG